MKKLFCLLILLFVFAACKKKAKIDTVDKIDTVARIDAVDKIVGSYAGTAHINVRESWRPRYGPEHTTDSDTTYQSTVIIKKVAPDYFLVVTEIRHIYPLDQSTFYNLGTNYKGNYAELSFHGDSTLLIHVYHHRSGASGASGFYSYSYTCDFTGTR